ncbi:hypothetical protein [Pseudobacillus badius]|uniref:hypothetical protein n=1 Tax=Bacillus badius TaxID=1455 RepID=UPI000A52AA7B|nr:hypothetical protein [Bacillus badius]UAT31706.1 hypothetical protein K7T73_05625 [Bacillus badius]GLY10606.1 hypothetical protein Bbad01_18220 [Bacillus badius]
MGWPGIDPVILIKRTFIRSALGMHDCREEVKVVDTERKKALERVVKPIERGSE